MISLAFSCSLALCTLCLYLALGSGYLLPCNKVGKSITPTAYENRETTANEDSGEIIQVGIKVRVSY